MLISIMGAEKGVYCHKDTSFPSWVFHCSLGLPLSSLWGKQRCPLYTIEERLGDRSMNCVSWESWFLWTWEVDCDLEAPRSSESMILRSKYCSAQGVPGVALDIWGTRSNGPAEAPFQHGRCALGIGITGECSVLSDDAMIPPWSLSPWTKTVCKCILGQAEISSVSEA